MQNKIVVKLDFLFTTYDQKQNGAFSSYVIVDVEKLIWFFEEKLGLRKKKPYVDCTYRSSKCCQKFKINNG